jgi:pSer/pThr/pTyr-binding forkhead associated (FHA) protein
MAYIVIRNTAGTEVARLAINGPTILGRATECEISLPDARLSRLHCRIDSENDAWTLTDLGSKNGTFVNEHPIDKFLLHDSDVFQLADWRITFHIGPLPPKRPKDPFSIDPTITSASPRSTDDASTNTHASIAEPPTKDGSTINGLAAPLAFQRPPAAPKVLLPATTSSTKKRRRYALPIAVFLLGLAAMTALYWYIFTH